MRIVHIVPHVPDTMQLQIKLCWNLRIVSVLKRLLYMCCIIWRFSGFAMKIWAHVSSFMVQWLGCLVSGSQPAGLRFDSQYKTIFSQNGNSTLQLNGMYPSLRRKTCFKSFYLYFHITKLYSTNIYYLYCVLFISCELSDPKFLSSGGLEP